MPSANGRDIAHGRHDLITLLVEAIFTAASKASEAAAFLAACQDA
jgi:hypothetical protein